MTFNIILLVLILASLGAIAGYYFIRTNIMRNVSMFCIEWATFYFGWYLGATFFSGVQDPLKALLGSMVMALAVMPLRVFFANKRQQEAKEANEKEKHK
ncbi:MAG: hypothetical protein ACRCTW_06800 [Lactococcus garvieae]